MATRLHEPFACRIRYIEFQHAAASIHNELLVMKGLVDHLACSFQARIQCPCRRAPKD
jgi:uncharacterized protein YjaZ